jgi:uncharacterized protein (DUF1697 family)
MAPKSETYIALLRGINLAGRNRLSMKDLARLLETNGCAGVRTYIQSGNAVFCGPSADPARLANRITAAIGKAHGFEPLVLLLTRAELERAAARNPFPEAHENPTSLHLFFLTSKPATPNLAGMEPLQTNGERFVLDDRVFYLHTPNGFGISKLAERAERLLGVSATARNWRTVTTLLEMVKTA